MIAQGLSASRSIRSSTFFPTSKKSTALRTSPSLKFRPQIVAPGVRSLERRAYRPKLSPMTSCSTGDILQTPRQIPKRTVREVTPDRPVVKRTRTTRKFVTSNPSLFATEQEDHFKVTHMKIPNMSDFLRCSEVLKIPECTVSFQGHSPCDPTDLQVTPSKGKELQDRDPISFKFKTLPIKPTEDHDWSDTTHSFFLDIPASFNLQKLCCMDDEIYCDANLHLNLIEASPVFKNEIDYGISTCLPPRKNTLESFNDNCSPLEWVDSDCSPLEWLACSDQGSDLLCWEDFPLELPELIF
eukprot:scaffold421336_cov57-Attheya_sp.AAC.3